jgi:hypothetical protein
MTSLIFPLAVCLVAIGYCCGAPPVCPKFNSIVDLKKVEDGADKLEKFPGPYKAPIEDVRQSKHNGKVRIEFLKATIRTEHLDKGSKPSDKMRPLMQEKGTFGNKDDSGHIVGKALGGTGDYEYNLFPQLVTINRGPYNQIESVARDFLKGGGPRHVILTARLKYDDKDRPLRPSALMYNMRVFVNKNQLSCEINDIMDNPLPKGKGGK